MLLKLQRYDLRVKYTPGKLLVAAHALSRARTAKTEGKSPQIEEDVTVRVNMVIETMPVADIRLKQIQQETAKDPGLKSLIHVILNG